MKIVFEGISSIEKDTILNEFINYLELSNIDYECVSDLVYDNPFKEAINQLLKKEYIMQANMRRAIYESLILAANHYYKHEKTYNTSNLVIYDGDLISLLAYQKEFLKEQYHNWYEFYTNFREIILFELKNIDLIIYVGNSLRLETEKTDSEDEILLKIRKLEFLNQVKNNMEEELKIIANYVPVLILENSCDLNDNVIKIKEKILELKRKI